MIFRMMSELRISWRGKARPGRDWLGEAGHGAAGAGKAGQGFSRRSLLMVAVSAVGIAIPRPAPAIIPVFDWFAASQWVQQIQNGVKELAYWAQQIKLMVDLITLQNIMNTVLGEGLGTTFTELLDSAQTLYDSGAGAFYSIQNLQGRLTNEMSLFLPPPGGYDSMTLDAMLYRAKRISEYTTKTNAAAAMWQARAIDKANLALAQAQEGAAQSKRAVSAVSATQAAAHILTAMSLQLDAIGRTSGLLATNIEAELMRRNTSEAMVQAQADKDIQAMKDALAGGQSMPAISPSSWH